MQESDTEALRRDIERLRAEVAQLNAHRFVRIHDNLRKLMGFQQ